jgi:hypothetical protein
MTDWSRSVNKPTTPWGTDAADFDRQLTEARDRSVATLRQASDHRRVEQLARNIHARLQGENQANALLALTKTLGVWLRSMPLNEQITSISIIAHLVTQEILGPDA